MGLSKEDLSHAIAIAAAAHSNQIDKAGNPYILHAIRVMQRVAAHGIGAQIVAVLHDVVEDTWVTLPLLREMGFPPEVVEGVDALTRREGEDYFGYIERCSRNAIGAWVKLADLEDNCSPQRAYEGRARLTERYGKARDMVMRAVERHQASTRSESTLPG
jgi:hypothetical protein